ncbi:MAG: NAD-dependent epimerase/dehydratase family protein [Planctomycetes bacterium]|nr:NAD-dependent epimerase/dehydratase family protein [Planctomycetota bacterium]
MNTTRRDFLQASAVAASLVGLGSATSRVMALPSNRRPAKKLKILILGGTRFLGPALVKSAQARGHEVTLFNRGRSNPHLFPDIEKLIGDRDPEKNDGLKALEGRTWDAVVDTSGYITRHARASAELLAEVVGQYVFISTISVYDESLQSGINEESPVGQLDDPSIEEITDGSFGPLKALCEQAVETALPGRSTIIRPGLIVGPLDTTYRYTYWPDRIARGGEVLAPGDGHDPVQIIDVRDLADFSIHCLEKGHTGVYNAVGPECRFTMAELVHGCKAVIGGCCTYTWVPGGFLIAQGVSEWTDMPVWVTSGGLSTVSNDRAREKGIRFRTYAVTAKDTFDWFSSLSEAMREKQRQQSSGISPDRESRILKAWFDSQ